MPRVASALIQPYCDVLGKVREVQKARSVVVILRVVHDQERLPCPKSVKNVLSRGSHQTHLGEGLHEQSIF